MMFQHIAAGAGVVMLVLFSSGCGNDGPTRYDISGKVTYSGAPVPAGTISFDPEEGETGGGFASIENGQYDTATGGRGHLGGKHKVTIVGTDGKRLNPNDPDSGMRAIFPPYNTEADLPKSKGTQDFEVPAG